MGKAIGIDLGTTFCCASYYDGNHVKIIPNPNGNRTTPSYVSFDSLQRLIGDEAKLQAALNPENTIYDIKRFMGVDFSNPQLQSELKYLPFKVTKQNEDSQVPLVNVTYREKPKQFQPEEISSFLLGYIKDFASDFLGETVTEAVITVPAYFDNTQRKATKAAGQMAGLKVLRIVNEPTAAALAYNKENKTDKQKTILVYDLGGGTFDVSLLRIEKNNEFTVLAVGGDTHLGGNNFDTLMVDYFLSDLMKSNSRIYGSVSEDKRAIRRLRNMCELTKRRLSNSLKASLEIDTFYKGNDFYTTIGRLKFEEICKDLFEKTLETVKTVLEDAKIEKSGVDEIVLVGGSTRIPKIHKLISEFFPGKKISKAISPDEAVAYGAGILAHELSVNTGTNSKTMSIQDVTPLSLGCNLYGGRTGVIVPRNTPIPCIKKSNYITVYDNQKSMTFSIVEGERYNWKDNTLLGEFSLSGLPPKLRGEAEVELCLNIDEDGILTVTAIDEEDKSNTASITITQHSDRFSKDQIQKMINDAKKYQEEDKLAKLRAESFSKLDLYLYKVGKKVGSKENNSSYHMSTRALENLIHDKSEWLKNNQYSATRQEMDDVYEKLVQMTKGLNISV